MIWVACSRPLLKNFSYTSTTNSIGVKSSFNNTTVNIGGGLVFDGSRSSSVV